MYTFVYVRYCTDVLHSHYFRSVLIKFFLFYHVFSTLHYSIPSHYFSFYLFHPYQVQSFKSPPFSLPLSLSHFSTSFHLHFYTFPFHFITSGEWVADNRHGRGVFFSRLMDVYKGDFRTNQFQGTGEMRYSDGSQYKVREKGIVCCFVLSCLHVILYQYFAWVMSCLVRVLS